MALRRRLRALRCNRSGDVSLRLLVLGKDVLDVIDERRERLLHVIRNVVEGLLRRGLRGLRFSGELLALILRAVHHRLGAVEVLGLRLGERFFKLGPELLGEIERLLRVIARLLRVGDESLDLGDVRLVIFVELLARFVVLLGRLGELLRLLCHRADLRFHFSECLGEHRVAAAARPFEHRLHLLDNALHNFFQVRRNVRVGLFGSRIASLGLGLRVVEDLLRRLALRLGAVPIVRLRLRQRGVALGKNFLGLVVGILAVRLGVVGVLDEVFDLVEVALVFIVVGLGGIEDLLGIGGQRLRLRDRLANTLFDLGKNLGEQRVVRPACLRHQLFDLVDDRPDGVRHILRHVRDRFFGCLVASLGFGLRSLKRLLRRGCVGLRALVVVRLLELGKRFLCLLDNILGRVERLLAVLFCFERIADKRLNLVEIRLQLSVLGLRLFEDFLGLGGNLLRLIDGGADALLDFGDRARQRRVVAATRAGN